MINKWDIRKRKAGEVAFSAKEGFINTSVTQVKQYQKEFQAEFCLKCIGWDSETNSFREKGNQNDPEDCLNHWTDIIGQCWNYKRQREG